MFIRIKKIKGSDYAYLTQNTWTEKGSRQSKTIYLGKIYRLGPLSVPFVPPSGTPLEFLHSLLGSLLKSAHFISPDGMVWTSDQIVINLTKKTVRYKAKRAVLEINEGFLCDLTLQNLLHFSERKYAQDLQHQELHPGKILAQRLLEAGIPMASSDFILTFEFLVPNADVLMRTN